MTNGARRRQRLENASSHKEQVPLFNPEELPETGRASSAFPSFDDPDPPIKNRMLHLVEMKEQLAQAKARHADQAAVPPQLRTVTATPGEPQPKSLGSARSKSKALTFMEATAQGQAQPSFLQGRPASPPGRPRGKPVRVTWVISRAATARKRIVSACSRGATSWPSCTRPWRPAICTRSSERAT